MNELGGYAFADLRVGMCATFAKTVTEADIVLFAAVSDDNNAIHINEEFAAGTIFKGRIAHGLLAASVISAAIANKLPGPGSIYVSQSLRFRAPVRADDTVRATVTVKEMIPVRSRVLLATVCTVGALVVIEGEALVALPAPSPLELAEMNKVHLAAGDKKAGIDAPWQKIKVDRQIIAIAKVAGAKTIYTNDASLKATAESAGLKVIGVHELPLPVKEDDGQHNFLELLERQAAAMNEIDDAKEITPPEEDEPGA